MYIVYIVVTSSEILGWADCACNVGCYFSSPCQPLDKTNAECFYRPVVRSETMLTVIDFTHYISSFLTTKSHDHTETTTSKVTTKHVPITQQTATPPAGQTSVALPVTDAYTNLKTVLPDPIENDSKSTSHLRGICLLASFWLLCE